MNKLLLGIAAVLVLLAGAFYFVLVGSQNQYHDSIEGEGNVLHLKNIDGSDITIVVGDYDSISADAKGDKGDADKIRFFKTGDRGAEFEIPEGWENVAVTLRVPKGTLLDVELSNDMTVGLGDQEIGNSDTFLVDTSTVNEITFGGSGFWIGGNGDVFVLNTDTWEELNPSDEDNKIPEDVPECSTGLQSVRNYCCERVNWGETTPDCTGQWEFNNTSLLCEYRCDNLDESNDDEENSEDSIEEMMEGDDDTDDMADDDDDSIPIVLDCSVGSQAFRDLCCEQQNVYSERSVCIGTWYFDNVARECAYRCLTEEELEEYFGGGGEEEALDATSEFCSHYPTIELKNACCEENLKTPLSIGPHPGFPDCIGHWYFNSEDGCLFQCADYGEMLDILESLRN